MVGLVNASGLAKVIPVAPCIADWYHLAMIADLPFWLKLWNKGALLRQEIEALLRDFANAGSPGDPDRVQDAWDTWVTWLKKNQLEYLPDNRKVLNKWVGYNFRQANSQQTASQLANQLIEDVKLTQLSPRS
jgi:hypothetical protein